MREEGKKHGWIDQGVGFKRVGKENEVLSGHARLVLQISQFSKVSVFFSRYIFIFIFICLLNTQFSALKSVSEFRKTNKAKIDDWISRIKKQKKKRKKEKLR